MARSLLHNNTNLVILQFFITEIQRIELKDSAKTGKISIRKMKELSERMNKRHF